jgi:site-specific DNA recombinase
MATDALSHLKRLSTLYSEANLEGKRYITGVIFPEKWVFDGKEHHTTKANEALLVIYLINHKLRHRNTVAKFIKNLNSGKALNAGVEPHSD